MKQNRTAAKQGTHFMKTAIRVRFDQLRVTASTPCTPCWVFSVGRSSSGLTSVACSWTPDSGEASVLLCWVSATATGVMDSSVARRQRADRRRDETGMARIRSARSVRSDHVKQKDAGDPCPYRGQASGPPRSAAAARNRCKPEDVQARPPDEAHQTQGTRSEEWQIINLIRWACLEERRVSGRFCRGSCAEPHSSVGGIMQQVHFGAIHHANIPQTPGRP